MAHQDDIEKDTKAITSGRAWPAFHDGPTVWMTPASDAVIRGAKLKDELLGEANRDPLPNVGNDELYRKVMGDRG